MSAELENNIIEYINPNELIDSYIGDNHERYEEDSADVLIEAQEHALAHLEGVIASFIKSNTGKQFEVINRNKQKVITCDEVALPSQLLLIESYNRTVTHYADKTLVIGECEIVVKTLN